MSSSSLNCASLGTRRLHLVLCNHHDRCPAELSFDRPPLSPRPPQLHLLSAHRRNRRSLPVGHRSLRVCDGVCFGLGLDEHSVLHQRTQAHWHLQHHDTEGKETTGGLQTAEGSTSCLCS